MVSVSYLSRLEKGRLVASLSRRTFDYLSQALAPNLVKGFEGIGEGKKTKMVTPFRNMARSFTSLAARWLVHSLAHELAASPEATSRLLSSAERCLARSDEGGAGEDRRLHEGEALVEALPLALQILL